MNQEKFGKLIKSLREKHHLTQKDLADKYHVTYQAVSKWENGKNMPDTSLIKQISEDFGISLKEMFDGEYKQDHKNKKILFIGSGVVIFVALIVILSIIFHPFHNEDFKFKTLASNCENFNISGTISYNNSKSAIYINHIQYCGGNDTEDYKRIECILYESNHNLDKKISSQIYDEKDTIKLEAFLQDVTLMVDDYEKTCKEYQDNTLYLSILATNKQDKTIAYKIPLKLESSCMVS